MSDLKTFLTPKEVAEKLRLAQSTVYRFAHLGILPGVKMGKSVRFKATSVDEYIEKAEQAGYGKAA